MPPGRDRPNPSPSKPAVAIARSYEPFPVGPRLRAITALTPTPMRTPPTLATNAAAVPALIDCGLSLSISRPLQQNKLLARRKAEPNEHRIDQVDRPAEEWHERREPC